MTLEMYESNGGRTMFKLDGKRVDCETAESAYLDGAEFINNTTCKPIEEFRTLLNATIPAAVEVKPVTLNEDDTPIIHTVNVSDRLAAINLIEESINYPFIINGKYKGCECVYAENAVGDTLEMHDDFIKVTKWRSKITTYFWLDIPESAMIAALEKLAIQAIESGTMPSTFTVTGTSGKVYTYAEKTLEVVSVEAGATQVTETSELVKAFRAKQAQFRNLVSKTDIKSAVLARRYSREIAALVGGMSNAQKTLH